MNYYHHQARSGFTLLEMIMVMVMVLVSLVIGGSLFMLSNNSSDEIQTLPARIEQLAKTSLLRAKLDKRTQYILVSSEHVWLSTDPEQKSPELDSKNTITLPPNCSIGYKRAGESQWQWLRNNSDKAIWTFSIAGICEELSFNIKIKDSSAEIRFHPLTATIIKP